MGRRKVFFGFFGAFLLASCAGGSSGARGASISARAKALEASSSNYLGSGYLVVARKIPSSRITPSRLFTFMPLPEEWREQLRYIDIDLGSGRINLYTNGEGDGSFSFYAGEIYGYFKGNSRVAFIYNNPLWYAPKEYFKLRGMKVPVEGSRERYLKGALGGKAVYLENGVIIHGGPFNLEGGNSIRLQPKQFSRFLKFVRSGIPVRIE